MDVEEEAMLREIFGEMDRDKDGKVWAQDVHQLLRRRALGGRFTRRELEAIVWEVDADGNGHLSYDDLKAMFARARGDRSGFEPYRLLNAIEFMMYDRGGTGFISLEECILMLSRRFGQTNLGGIQADLRKFFLDVAGGKDKRVSFDEFVNQVEVRKMLLSN
jgi:calmodulin